MPSLRDEVRALVAGGHARALLSEHVRNWRHCRTPYTIDNAVRLAAAEGRGGDLHDAILDGVFRDLRQSMFDVNALRADLHVARSYFLKHEPDLLRYVQVLLLEQRPFGTPESVLTQQQHCREYADFLQLDRLVHERLDTGLHRVLRRFFPDGPGGAQSPDADDDAPRLRLARYELGDWRCSCGQVTGHARRFDHSCPCGAASGHGRITETTPGCPEPACAGLLDYVVCPGCRTRVTLANLWQTRRGGAGPADFLLPLFVDLVVEDRWATIERVVRRTLMYLPLPIGLQERDGEIVFDAPAVFWAHQLMQGWDRLDEGDRFLGLKDTLRYDGQSRLGPILDALLRRTLLGYRGGYARFTDDLLLDVIERLTKPGGSRGQGSWHTRTSRYTRGFWDRLGRVAVRDLELGDLVSRGAISAQCTVVVSPRLRGTAALVNGRLTDPNSLSVPTLRQLTLRLPHDAVLTPHPPTVGEEQAAGLQKCGLVAPGQPVRPGQLLVGAAAPYGMQGPRTPEERLMYTLFGDRALQNRSLSMPGRLPGYVLAQRISGTLATDAIPAAPGRDLQGGVSATHITVTVAVDQPLQHGDELGDESGATVVVCGLAGGPTLRRLAGSPSEPDLVVAPDHPWAPAPGEAERTVRVRLAAHDLAGPGTGARSTGGYSLVLQQPVSSTTGDGAQMFEPREFQWLVDHGARHLAMELYGPRCDCASWRTHLSASLRAGGGPLGPPRDLPTALHDSPAHAVRRLDLTLRAARIVPRLEAGRIALRLMDDAEVVHSSHGEVVNPELFNLRTGRPMPGGLFCRRIFGPDRENECVCGETHRPRDVGHACRACGSTLTTPHERGRRFGHIELPVSVVHGWYLRGTAGARLACSLRLTEPELRQLADCELVLVTDPGPTALRAGQLLSFQEWQNTVGWTEASAVTGGQAVKVLLHRIGDSALAGDLDTVVVRRLPVLPPDLRPHIRTEDGWWLGSDLNNLYSAVLSSAATVRQWDDRPPSMLMEARRRLQHSVSKLLDNAHQPEPAQGSQRRRLVGIGDWLTARRDSTGPLRNDFLRRPVDFSARSQLVIGRLPDEDEAVPDPGTVLLGRDLALRLVQPLLVHALTSSGAAADTTDAQAMIRNRAEEAMRLLDTVCERTPVLVALPYGPWPLVALRLRPDGISALQVQPGLLDLVGWRNLGQPVRTFSVLTDEAVREATDLLTPDALCRPREQVQPRPATGDSLFDLPCEELADRLAEAAFSADSFRVSPDDGLLLCDPGWLGRTISEEAADHALSRA
ncbi:hypothetical protein ACFYRC_07605 [Streptomyces sp. NPDC005279]|uniref:hypothetical protein n=1 Tax=Streptomyces sp. NPDC005279 TaxID=3364712 RepID=UPI00368B5256